MHTYGGDPSLAGVQHQHLEQAGAGRAGFGSCQGSITPRQSRAGGFSAPSQLHLPTHGFSASARGCSGAARVLHVALRGEGWPGKGSAGEKTGLQGSLGRSRVWRRLQALRGRWHEVPEPRVGRTSPRDRTGSGRTGKSLIQNADKSRELFLSEMISH